MTIIHILSFQTQISSSWYTHVQYTYTGISLASENRIKPARNIAVIISADKLDSWRLELSSLLLFTLLCETEDTFTKTLNFEWYICHHCKQHMWRAGMQSLTTKWDRAQWTVNFGVSLAHHMLWYLVSVLQQFSNFCRTCAQGLALLDLENLSGSFFQLHACTLMTPKWRRTP